MYNNERKLGQIVQCLGFSVGQQEKERIGDIYRRKREFIKKNARWFTVHSSQFKG